MCGIVACQSSNPALSFLLPALAQLEYRGYDSAGVVVASERGELVRLRSVGRLAHLSQLVDGYDGPTLDGVGIGHTRWATHGAVTEQNAHPHADCAGTTFVVHNGIIENAAELRTELITQGHRFASEVDSEVAAHLIEAALQAGAPTTADAVREAVTRMTGSWALAVLREGERSVVLTAHHSPLLVAQTPRGAYAASDMSALAGIAEEVQVLEDGDLVEFTGDGLRWLRADGTLVGPERIAGLPFEAVDRAEAPDFMAKEIAEQAEVAAGLVARHGQGLTDGRLWRELGLPALRRVRFVACGTSLNAATALSRLLATAGVPATLGPASEIGALAHEPDTLTIALSQSGETADVLRALDRRRGPVLALTNAPHSTLGRRADAVIDLAAGVEIGVAATKTFTAQVVAGSAVLLSGLVAAGHLDRRAAGELARHLAEIPEALDVAHALAGEYARDLAAELATAPGFLFVARGSAVPYAAEGALKLKELSYRWAECHPAGELKHGPLALIEPGTPVVVVDDGHPKLDGNLAEMASRGARIVAVGGPHSQLPYRRTPAVAVPWGPLAGVVPLQHLAREIAVALGRDVDKPRNLAKSVTVE